MFLTIQQCIQCIVLKTTALGIMVTFCKKNPIICTGIGVSILILTLSIWALVFFWNPVAVCLTGLTIDRTSDPKELKQFHIYDKNGDGFIHVDELKSVMKGQGNLPTDQEVEKKLGKEDTNGDGQISFEEFVAKR